jgi:benzoate/toluate 1,2-dioxygenase reductase subunit
MLKTLICGGSMANEGWIATKVARIVKPKGTYLYLTLRIPEEYEYKAGQYTIMRIIDGEGEFKAYYSIASSPSPENLMDFCIVSDQNPRISEFLSSLSEGSVVDIMPSATGTFDMSLVNGPAVFIAGGSGIAPLRAMIQNLASQVEKRQVHLLYGCKAAGEIPFIEEFERMAEENPTFTAWFCAESGSRNNVKSGRVDSCLKDAQIGDANYFLCGPPKMLESLKLHLAGSGVVESRIFTEGY